MKDIPKETLIKAARGDMEAFEYIYRTTSGFVYSVALRVIHNNADAQEVTQDVFFKIHKNLRNFGFRASFKTWVYRITTNTAINRYRQRAKEAARRGDYDTAIKTKGVEGEAAKSIEQEDNQSRVMSLLAVLNADQRACLVLREIEGLSYEEIAKVLKININTVRSRLKRARFALLNRGQRGDSK